MFSIERKLNLLIAALLLLITAITITFNAFFFQRSMHEQLVSQQLPLVSNEILSEIDRQIMEVSRGIMLIVNSPQLHDWIRIGEPNEGHIDGIYRLLQTAPDTYGTASANFASNKTKQYTALRDGKRDHSYHLTEDDVWFSDFRDRGLSISSNVYVNDPVWGTSVYMNRKVEVDNTFAGLITFSIDIKDLIKELGGMTIGTHGRTFIVDDKGFIRIHENVDFLNKPLSDIYPEYASLWPSIVQSDQFQASFDQEDDTRYTITKKIPVLGFYLITEASEAEFMQDVQKSIFFSIGVSVLLTIIISLVFGTLTSRSITKPVKLLAGTLTEGANQVDKASNQLTSAAKILVHGATENAASLEETSAALEELSSMSHSNADNSIEANVLMGQAGLAVQEADSSMAKVITAMEEISISGNEISKIIKTIDEIAFQTNLLALNAAVEAARAGEAGAGFAVVADEVRNLANRSAEAAKNTSNLIASTISNISSGTDMVNLTAENFKTVAEHAEKVVDLLAEISKASKEQAQGIGQITTTISEMDKVIQSNVTSAEESASAAGQLSLQAGTLLDAVDDLNTLVYGRG